MAIEDIVSGVKQELIGHVDPRYGLRAGVEAQRAEDFVPEVRCGVG